MAVLDPENFPEDEPTLSAHPRNYSHDEQTNRFDIAQSLPLAHQFELAKMMVEVDRAFNLDCLPPCASHVRFSVPDLNIRSERLKEFITLLYQKTVLQQNLLLNFYKQASGIESPPLKAPPQ